MQDIKYAALLELLWTRQQVEESAQYHEDKIQRALDTYRECTGKLHDNRLRLLELEAEIDALWFPHGSSVTATQPEFVDAYEIKF